MVFGGAMHVDQEAHHPWLREEEQYVRTLLDRRVPLLGVCLGAQMVAKAAGARVGPAAEPEIGWCDVDRKVDDPVLGVLPARFPAFQWHFYAFDVPADAAELARSRVCPQAFRLGEQAWAVQFHPEVTREIVAGWVAEAPDEVPGGADALLAETDRANRRVDAPRARALRGVPGYRGGLLLEARCETRQRSGLRRYSARWGRHRVKVR